MTMALSKKKLNKKVFWLFLPIGLSIAGSELNKVIIPLPSFQSNEQISDILPKSKRIKSSEIDLTSQEGFNIAIEELSKADDARQPKLKVNSIGQMTYHYYRKQGEPPKTQKELDELIRNSRDYENFQRKIAQLLTILADHNVLVVVGEPALRGAAGEWDPSRQTIRISPGSLSKGSEVLLKILNHESIHVAQSCHNGGINFKPKPLGIQLSPTKIFHQQLSSDIYSQIGEKTKRLESEAYSYEYSSKAARHFLFQHCKALGS